MKVSGFTLKCNEYDHLIKILMDTFTNNYIGEKTKLYHISDDVVALYYENYSFRIASNLMVSVIIQKIDNEQVKFKIFSGGGKQGMLAIGWGAEKSRITLFLDFIIELVKKMNWLFIEIEDEIKNYIEKHAKNNIGYSLE